MILLKIWLQTRLKLIFPGTYQKMNSVLKNYKGKFINFDKIELNIEGLKIDLVEPDRSLEKFMRKFVVVDLNYYYCIH